MSEDLQSLINKNPCGICKLKGLSICKCAGSSGGGNSDDAEDVKNDRENFYNTQFQSNIATHKENKSDVRAQYPR